MVSIPTYILADDNVNGYTLYYNNHVGVSGVLQYQGFVTTI